MRSTTVRITKAKYLQRWYADKVDEMFEVYPAPAADSFVLKEDRDRFGLYDGSAHIRFILREDCEEEET